MANTARAMLSDVPENSEAAEPAAKAQLLDFLRKSKLLRRGSAVTTELILDKHSVRADVVLCNAQGFHCFEIKTRRDTLTRLDNQVRTYATHADFVTVVAASKHINAVLSRVPEYIGVYELMSSSFIRVLREPSQSPVVDSDAMLSILPVAEINARLGFTARLRSEALTSAKIIDAAIKKDAVLKFFVARYSSTTSALLAASRRRTILPKDLIHLKRWLRTSGAGERLAIPSPSKGGYCPDACMYHEVGKSFGPVPDEVRHLLMA